MSNQNVLRISLEGLDGSGKSTARQNLVDHYESSGVEVVSLTSPSRRSSGLYLRQNLFSLSSEEKERLFIEDMKESDVAIPPAADIAIWDRHIDSVYTSNVESNLGRISALAAGLIMPKRTFYLRLSSDAAYDRAAPITDHALDKEWLDLKHKRYEELLNANPDRIIPIDASQSADVVLEEIIENVEEL